MRRLDMRHPEEEQLLRYADGELPSRAAGEVRSHLEACWQCRAQLEQLQEVVTQCVAYRKNVLQRHLPPPPAPWADIYRRFEEIDISFAQPSLMQRIGRAFEWPLHNAPKWAPVAVALLLVFFLVYRYRVTPSVQAAELLQKAIVAAEKQPVKQHRIQVRTKAHQFTRLAGPQGKLAARSSEIDSLQAMFVAANYNWDDPLSAKAFQTWRNQLPEKRDAVVQDQNSYSIRTDTPSGDLREATLRLETPDLQPVQGRFEFRNQEWVEITALADEIVPPAEAIATTPEAHVNPPAITPPITSASPATIGDELRVMAALHQVGADLGDPIEVARSGGEILVTGVGIAPQRRQEIQSALSAQAHVTVRFSDSAPSYARPEPAATDSTVTGADIRQLQSRIAEQVGGRANFEQLASQVLDLSEPMMARVYALRRLAERFPVEAESQMNPQDRQLLRQLQREHVAALRQRIAEIDRLVRPALASIRGAGGSPPGALSATAWQPATEELFQSARRAEKLLAVMFGAAPGESAGEQLPAQLLSSLAQLRAKVEGYDRISANTER